MIGPQPITSWFNFETVFSVFNLYTSNFCRMEKSPENRGCNLHICKFSSLLVSVCPIVNNAQGDNTILHIFVNIPRTRSHGGPGSQPGARVHIVQVKMDSVSNKTQGELARQIT